LEKSTEEEAPVPAGGIVNDISEMDSSTNVVAPDFHLYESKSTAKS